jgi:hypothetical protein
MKAEEILKKRKERQGLVAVLVALGFAVWCAPMRRHAVANSASN